MKNTTVYVKCKQCECCGGQPEIDIKKLILDAQKAGIKIVGVCNNCGNSENVPYSNIKEIKNKK